MENFSFGNSSGIPLARTVFSINGTYEFVPYTVFHVRRITFFLVNRVENQNEPKQPQKWWLFGFVLVFNSPTAMGGTDY